MKQISLLAATILLGALAALAQQQAPSTVAAGSPENDEKITAVLEEMVRSHHTYLSVPAEDGKALRLLTQALEQRM